MRRAFSVAVYPRHAGRVLLIRHQGLGVWLPPGGEIEPGETPLQAAQRALRQETGLEGSFPHTSEIDGAPPGMIGYEEHLAGAKGTHLNFVFVADVLSEIVRANDPLDAWKWVAQADEITDAPRSVAELARLALQPPLRDTARRWLAAFNARDLDALLALYAEEAVHHSPKLPPPHKIMGRAALRAWWQDCFDRLPALRYAERALTAQGDRVWMEYDRLLPGQPTLRIAEVLRVQGARIVESRVFHGS
jgi:ADP-ribose pyrophosphatase YjhB (NUDIX family)